MGTNSGLGNAVAIGASTFLLTSGVAWLTSKALFSSPRRTKQITPAAERVLILGASSGVGRTIAHFYADRDARIAVVGRRANKIDEVVEECVERLGGKVGRKRVVGYAADLTDVDAMVKLRDRIQQEWEGLDTLIIPAGVSALQPLLSVAGLENNGGVLALGQVSREGVQDAVAAAQAAIQGNYIGPLVAAVTFIPLLSATSQSPSILLVSSVAGLIPPPTRTIYGSTKAASLLLYQALSIEHPNITFTNLLPATIEGDFRASAVDKGPVREADPNKTGLKRDVVARRCIEAIDNRERTVFMPGLMRWGHLLYWIWPRFVEKKARVKYNF